MRDSEKFAVKGWVVGLTVAGAISLFQFAPQPNIFSNVHATALIWVIAVASMFAYTIGSD